MIVDDGGFGVGGEGELPDLDLASGFFGLGLSQAHAADLRLTVSAAGDMVFVDRLGRLAGDTGNGHNAAHAAYVRKLRKPGDDVTDGVNAFFSGLHPFIGVNEAALDFDVGRLLQANALGVRSAAHRDQDLFRFQLLRGFALRREADRHSVFRLLHFFNFGVDEAVDAFLLERPKQFLGNVFIFHRHQAGQHLDNRDLCAERAIDGSKFHAHRSGANDDHRFGNGGQAEHFNIGKDAGVGVEPGQHARERAGGKNDVFCLNLAGAFAAFNLNRVHAVLCGAGEAAEAEHAVNLVLADEKIEPLGVLGDDLVLAVLNILPVELACSQAVNAVLFGVLEMVIDFSIEEQGFGGDAANVQACAAELVVFFDEAGFQSKLARAECGGVSAGSGADDGDVINGVWHSSAPSGRKNREKANR